MMDHLGDVAAFITALGVLTNAVMGLYTLIGNRRLHAQNNAIIKATNGLLKQRIEVERKDATAEGNLAGRAEAKDEAKDRGDVRGKN